MTGKELILYILQHNLENEVVIKDGVFSWFIDEDTMAKKYEVGKETIRAWNKLGWINGFEINGTLYFADDSIDLSNTPNKGYER